MAGVDPSVSPSRRASFWDPKPTFLRHGLLIFLAQILTLLLVPMLDNGDTLMPIPFAVIAFAGAAFTILSLGYRRLAVAIAVTGVVGILYLTSMPSPNQFNRFPTMLVLILAYCLSVCLAIYHAFAANLTSSQRILCGAASFVMVGFVFAAALCTVVNPTPICCRWVLKGGDHPAGSTFSGSASPRSRLPASATWCPWGRGLACCQRWKACAAFFSRPR